MKRKHEEREEEEEGANGGQRRSGQGRAKAGRREEPGPSQTFLESRPWDVKAGMILEVNLRNFMCHEVIQSYASPPSPPTCTVDSFGSGSTYLTRFARGTAT